MAGTKEVLSPEEQALVDEAVARASETGYTVAPHECFRNAQTLLMAEVGRRFSYWEGYLPHPEGAAPHAWLTLNGKIVDLTLQADAAAYGKDFVILFQKMGYYGGKCIPFQIVEAYFAQAASTGRYGSVLGLVFLRKEELDSLLDSGHG